MSIRAKANFKRIVNKVITANKLKKTQAATTAGVVADTKRVDVKAAIDEIERSAGKTQDKVGELANGLGSKNTTTTTTSKTEDLPSTTAAPVTNSTVSVESKKVNDSFQLLADFHVVTDDSVDGNMDGAEEAKLKENMTNTATETKKTDSAELETLFKKLSANESDKVSALAVRLCDGFEGLDKIIAQLPPGSVDINSTELMKALLTAIESKDTDKINDAFKAISQAFTDVKGVLEQNPELKASLPGFFSSASDIAAGQSNPTGWIDKWVNVIPESITQSPNISGSDTDTSAASNTTATAAQPANAAQHGLDPRIDSEHIDAEYKETDDRIKTDPNAMTSIISESELEEDCETRELRYQSSTLDKVENRRELANQLKLGLRDLNKMIDVLKAKGEVPDNLSKDEMSALLVNLMTAIDDNNDDVVNECLAQLKTSFDTVKDLLNSLDEEIIQEELPGYCTNASELATVSGNSNPAGWLDAWSNTLQEAIDTEYDDSTEVEVKSEGATNESGILQEPTDVVSAEAKAVTNETKSNEDAAATKIQALARGMNLRNKRNDAASKIQGLVRGRADRKRLDAMSKAATSIQSFVRGRAARKDIQVKNEAATKIQTKFRQLNAEKKYKKQKESAIKLQALARGIQTREKVTKKKKSFNKAATKIQARVRMIQAKKELSELKEAKLEAKRVEEAKQEAIAKAVSEFEGNVNALSHELQVVSDAIKPNPETKDEQPNDISGMRAQVNDLNSERGTLNNLLIQLTNLERDSSEIPESIKDDISADLENKHTGNNEKIETLKAEINEKITALDEKIKTTKAKIEDKIEIQNQEARHRERQAKIENKKSVLKGLLSEGKPVHLDAQFQRENFSAEEKDAIIDEVIKFAMEGDDLGKIKKRVAKLKVRDSTLKAKIKAKINKEFNTKFNDLIDSKLTAISTAANFDDLLPILIEIDTMINKMGLDSKNDEKQINTIKEKIQNSLSKFKPSNDLVTINENLKTRKNNEKQLKYSNSALFIKLKKQKETLKQKSEILVEKLEKMNSKKQLRALDQTESSLLESLKEALGPNQDIFNESEKAQYKRTIAKFQKRLDKQNNRKIEVDMIMGKSQRVNADDITNLGKLREFIANPGELGRGKSKQDIQKEKFRALLATLPDNQFEQPTDSNLIALLVSNETLQNEYKMEAKIRQYHKSVANKEDPLSRCRESIRTKLEVQEMITSAAEKAAEKLYEKNEENFNKAKRLSAEGIKAGVNNTIKNFTINGQSLEAFVLEKFGEGANIKKEVAKIKLILIKKILERTSIPSTLINPDTGKAISAYISSDKIGMTLDKTEQDTFVKDLEAALSIDAPDIHGLQAEGIDIIPMKQTEDVVKKRLSNISKIFSTAEDLLAGNEDIQAAYQRYETNINDISTLFTETFGSDDHITLEKLSSLDRGQLLSTLEALYGDKRDDVLKMIYTLETLELQKEKLFTNEGTEINESSGKYVKNPASFESIMSAAESMFPGDDPKSKEGRNEVLTNFFKVMKKDKKVYSEKQMDCFKKGLSAVKDNKEVKWNLKAGEGKSMLAKDFASICPKSAFKGSGIQFLIAPFSDNTDSSWHSPFSKGTTVRPESVKPSELLQMTQITMTAEEAIAFIDYWTNPDNINSKEEKALETLFQGSTFFLDEDDDIHYKTDQETEFVDLRSRLSKHTKKSSFIAMSATKNRAKLINSTKTKCQRLMDIATQLNDADIQETLRTMEEHITNGKWGDVAKLAQELRQSVSTLEKKALKKNIGAVQSRRASGKQFEGRIEHYLDQIIEFSNDLNTGEAKQKVEDRVFPAGEGVLQTTNNNTPESLVGEAFTQISENTDPNKNTSLVICPDVKDSEIETLQAALLAKTKGNNNIVLMRHEAGTYKGKLMMAIDGTWKEYKESKTTLRKKQKKEKLNIVCMYTKDSVGGDFDEWSNQKVASQSILYTNEPPKINSVYQNLKRYRGEEQIPLNVYVPEGTPTDKVSFLENVEDKQNQEDISDSRKLLEQKQTRQIVKAVQEHFAKEKSSSINELVNEKVTSKIEKKFIETNRGAIKSGKNDIGKFFFGDKVKEQESRKTSKGIAFFDLRGDFNSLTIGDGLQVKINPDLLDPEYNNQGIEGVERNLDELEKLYNTGRSLTSSPKALFKKNNWTALSKEIEGLREILNNAKKEAEAEYEKREGRAIEEQLQKFSEHNNLEDVDKSYRSSQHFQMAQFFHDQLGTQIAEGGVGSRPMGRTRDAA
ncbi:hypothetical protein DID75_05585 [Candidatus Marinamargulisbacteria bacterium SCGC AG-410-N11]|nr:hypothetical protein DID75_05585 [Candidatus Marinamargulisbacteria bacterium SCGC AG-410-N11]